MTLIDAGAPGSRVRVLHGARRPVDSRGPLRPEHRVIRCATRALHVLGLTPIGPMTRCPTLASRPTRQVVRTTIGVMPRDHQRDAAPDPLHLSVSESNVADEEAEWDVAVKVLLDPDDATKEAFAWEHTVARDLHRIAARRPDVRGHRRNPVVRLLHQEPIDLGDACVAVSQFVHGCGEPLTVGGWARTLGVLHQIGSTPEALALLSEHPSSNLLFGLRADAMLEALHRPGHPFHDDSALVREFARALRERAMRAIGLDPVPLLAHRDFHPLNCINACDGPVAIDWQDAGWGNRSDDFAWLHLAVRRFGRPERMLSIARHAYASASGGTCPSREQIEASGQVLELLCLGFSLMNADQDPRYLQECLTELPVLTDPNANTSPWQMLNNPAIFTPGLVI